MDVLKHWQRLKPVSHQPISIGLINQTFRIEAESGLFILQKLHPVFSPLVNEDIQAITNYLHSHDFLAPNLISTDSNEPCVREGADCWRMLSFIAGKTYHQIPALKHAFSAGMLLGRFHRLLIEWNYRYQSVRTLVHRTPTYLDTLERTLSHHKNSPYYAKASPIAHRLLTIARTLPDLWNLPLRHCHGDLKISNLLFNDSDEAICLIDLDTLGQMPWPIEMGDAFRSWCNPRGEDQANSQFDLDIYRASLDGYQSEVWEHWTSQERHALPMGIKMITLELCARFMTDIFEDCYFGWDSNRFESRQEHNWIRTLGQWTLFLDLEKKL